MTLRIESQLPTEFEGLFLRYDVAPSVFLSASIGTKHSLLTEDALTVPRSQPLSLFSGLWFERCQPSPLKMGPVPTV